MHKIVATQWIHSFSCSMIFMIWFLWGDPSMRFLVDSSASTMQAYFVLQFFHRDRFPCTAHVEFCKALRLAWELPTFYAHSSWYLWILHLVQTVELRFFDSPLLLFSSLRRLRHIFPYLWPQRFWSGGRLFSCQSLTGPRISLQQFFTHYSESCGTVHVSDNSRFFIKVPIIIDIFSSVTSKGACVALVTSMYFSGKQFESGFHVMTVNEVAWNGPETISSFTIIQRWVLK